MFLKMLKTVTAAVFASTRVVREGVPMSMVPARLETAKAVLWGLLMLAAKRPCHGIAARVRLGREFVIVIYKGA